MENQITNTLQASKSQVERILNYEDDLKRIFASQHVSNIKRTLNFMTEQLTTVINGGNVVPTSEEMNMAAEMARVFANIALEKPIEPIFRDLSASYLLIIHNWNEATIKNHNISTNVKMTNGIVKAQLTLMDTIDVLQKTLEKIRKTHLYEPPAFNLSRSYLDNLKKAIEEKGPDALVPKKPDNVSNQES
ncbi:MAG: hypothetical protein WC565_01595 [Parcubacteria group bacterium]